MPRFVRILTVVLLVLGVGARAFECHDHGAGAFPDGCALCRAAHAPLLLPTASAGAEALALDTAGSAIAGPERLAPQVPEREVLRLRAPPVNAYA